VFPAQSPPGQNEVGGFCLQTPPGSCRLGGLMIGVERLSKILRVMASSDSVLPESARLSGILIAPSDAGKSELMLSHLPRGARVLDDFTSASLYNLVEEKPRPHWVVVPDLNALIAHKPSVANLTMANLLSLLGEGTTEILGPDGSKVKITDEKNGIRLGIITGITPEMFNSKRFRWRATGFLRRLVPIYYTYGPETQSIIQSSIRTGHHKQNYVRQEMPPVPKPKKVEIARSVAQEIQALSEYNIRYLLRWGGKTEDDPRSVRAFDLPFSVHKTFRRFAQSHARLNGRLAVKAKDLDALKDFSLFVRYDQPEVL
jgi:hypothetical protein